VVVSGLDVVGKNPGMTLNLLLIVRVVSQSVQLYLILRLSLCVFDLEPPRELEVFLDGRLIVPPLFNLCLIHKH
jgi:hypothetical protein